MNTFSLAADQLTRYPLAQAQDLIKALYQAHLGCGHLVDDPAAASRFLRDELARAQEPLKTPLCESLGAYTRVHLGPYAESGASADTLCALFLLSACAETPDARASFSQALDELAAYPCSLPLAEAVSAYRAQGMPLVRHTQVFRDAYAPAYRVLRTPYAALLPLLARIDALLAARRHTVIAVDGPCGSGKTAFAELLARLYHAPVFHLDDFFLQPHQRTPERLAIPGENVDHERFLSEVLRPLSSGAAPAYRRFDCKTGTLCPPVCVQPGRLSIVEGSYSLHRSLSPLYDLRILLTISPQDQLLRLRERSPQMLDAFISRWIPLEQRYFTQDAPHTRCDLFLHISAAAGQPNQWKVSELSV